MNLKRGDSLTLFNSGPSSFCRVEGIVLYNNSYRDSLTVEVPIFQIEQLKKIISGSGFVYLYAHEKGLAYKCKLKSCDDTTLILESPINSIKVDKRDSERKMIKEGLKIELSHGTKILKKECYDISLTGFSLLIGSLEKDWLDLKFIGKAKIIFDEDKGRMKVENIGFIKLAAYANENAPFAKYRISYKICAKEKVTEKLLQKILK